MMRGAVFVVVSVLACGCSLAWPSIQSAPDAAVDASPDAAVDVAVDASPDALVDVALDASPDAPDVPDAPGEIDDVVAEAGRDADADVPADAACLAPRSMCASGCADVRTDPANCGRCDNRCPAGEACAAGVCAALAGAACVRDSDCGAAGACLAAGGGFPGGYCIYACPAASVPGDPCAMGTGVCVDPEGQRLCLRGCTPGATGSCRSGYLCLREPEGGAVDVCYPDCRLNPALLCAPFLCDAATGRCSRACAASSMCSAGSTCTASSCRCTGATNCGANRRCYVRAAPSVSSCGCASSAACAAGRTCDTSTGGCV